MLRIAVVGTGYIGRTHLDVWAKMSDVIIAAVCTSTAKKGVEMAHCYYCSHYQDLKQLLAQETIDIIDICTPTFLHEQNIIDAASHGVNIICEKPVALSISSMERIIQITEQAGVLLMIGHVLRFWSEYDMIKSMYDAHRFGKIRSVYAHRLAQYPPNTTWRHDAAGSGGGLFDLTLHDVDYLIYLFGEVESLYASGVQSPTGCWDHVSAILNFRNGVNATLEGVLGMPDGYAFSTALRIIGEDISVEYDMSSGITIGDLHTARSSVVLYERGQDPCILKPQLATNFQAELTYFATCVRTKQPPEKIRPCEALYTLHILLAIEESLKTRQLIQISQEITIRK